MLPNSKSKMKKQIKNKKSSPEGKLVVLNEEELIQQVSMRPVIYDRSLKAYRKTTLRQQCWKEISDAMDASVEECRRRWRSLRDSFAKHYKAAQKMDEGTARKHRKWLFYDKMTFLIPHLEGVSYEFDKILNELGDCSEDGQSINCEPVDINTSAGTLPENEQPIANDIEDAEKQSSNLQHSSVSVQATDFMNNLLENPQQHTQVSNSNIDHFPRHQHYGETNNDSCGLLDSEEKFLLSCAPTLRRLTIKQNALARLKIQQILYDIEFQSDN